ncbi:MAG TPA: hypothetical protein VIW23_05135 [Candidatus Acidoferrum sp.]|jgi:hypothetical protein
MSWKKALRASGLVACCFLAPAALFAQGGYLDVYIAKLKPEKAAEAEAIAKKITDANRNNNGDRVIVEQPLYGDPYTLVFVTPRESYADVDKGNDAFMASVNKAFGKEGSQKILNEWNNCLVSVRTQLRIRRSDLSSKMPADPQTFAQLVGESRVLRTFVFHARPGRASEFEATIKEINAHADKMPDTQPVSVSQVVDGENNGAYYITFLRKSLGGFDKEVMLSDILGKEGMEKFEKTMADVEQRTESTLYRFRPDLSYPPDAVAQASADYWNPKPVMASAKPKAKTPAAPAAAKSTDKSQK